MRKLLLLFLFGNIVFLLSANDTPDYNEQEIIARIKQMKDGAVKARYTTIVKAYLQGYLNYRKDGSERILGKSIMYFPMFEEQLQEYDLPDDLKYLAIVESALDPKAVSRAGAVGLWQFMPPTAKDMGLKMNQYVDERRDPHKSTQAAMRYLKMQYKRFGSWELALAAYNGGSGTVSRAIKRGRSKDFWRIRNFLPKETRNYVPAYIAACYLGHYYDQHEIVPIYPQLDAQLTARMTVYGYFAFPKISKLTGLSVEEISALNPIYKKNFIPNTEGGNTLTLPIRVLPSVQAYFEANKPDTGEKIDDESLIASIIKTVPSKEDFYYRSNYTVREGQTIDSLSNLFEIKPHYIRAWNKMSHRMDTGEGHVLTLHGVNITAVEETLAKQEEELIVNIEPIKEVEELPATPIEQVVEESEQVPDNAVERENYLYYKVEANENLSQIAEKFEDVSVRDIMILNNFRSTQIPRAGKEIKVKKM